jgi:hypothetical protein
VSEKSLRAAAVPGLRALKWGAVRSWETNGNDRRGNPRPINPKEEGNQRCKMPPAWRSKRETPVDSYARQKIQCRESRFLELLGKIVAGCFQVCGKEEVICSG